MKKLITFILLLAILGGLYFWSVQNTKNEETMIGKMVSDFGQSLKNVSLLSPDAAQSIHDTYITYLSPELINQWVSDPSKALGRPVSSPWPDSIQISSIEKVSSIKYSVSGNLIEMTSTGIIGKRDITLIVEKIKRQWLISSITLAPYDPTLIWPVYTEDTLFAFKYPSEFTIQSKMGLGGAFLSNPIVKVSFPASAKDGKTNYSEAYMVVSSSTSSPNCTTFTDFPYIPNPQPQTKTINGIEFKVEQVTDAGAGNLYTSKLYRTIYNNTCYELSLTVHTGNIFNYPEGTVTEFDKTKAFKVLEEITNTFHFLN